MNNTILTAEEWLTNHKELSIYDVEEYDEGGYLGVNENKLYQIMIEFARLHCEAQLKAILEKASVKTCDEHRQEVCNIDEDSIINAYPLNQIK